MIIIKGNNCLLLINYYNDIKNTKYYCLLLQNLTYKSYIIITIIVMSLLCILTFLYSRIFSSRNSNMFRKYEPSSSKFLYQFIWLRAHGSGGGGINEYQQYK